MQMTSYRASLAVRSGHREERQVLVMLLVPSAAIGITSKQLLLLLQSALQPLVGFGLLYDFVPQSSIFTLLSPVSHFHLL